MEILSKVLSIVPFFFIAIYLIAAARAASRPDAELTEIKHVIYAILWMLIAIGGRIA